VAAVFGFHPLAVEDCRAVSHEPKFEVYDGHAFLIVHAIDAESIDRRVTTTDLECFFAERYLVTHHVRQHGALDQLAARVDGDPSLLAGGIDRVLHELLDGIVDRYFPAVAAMETRAEVLETALVKAEARDGRRARALLPRMLDLKGEVTHLKRIVSPEVEVVAKLAGRALPIVSSQAAFYFRDVLDRLIEILLGPFNLLLEPLNVCSDAPGHRFGCHLKAVVLRDEHLQELASSGENRLQNLDFLIGKDARTRPYRSRQTGEYFGVYSIGLGKATGGLGEIPRLAGVYDRNGDAYRSDGGCRGTLRVR
jgi:hypothetical protein